MTPVWIVRRLRAAVAARMPTSRAAAMSRNGGLRRAESSKTQPQAVAAVPAEDREEDAFCLTGSFLRIERNPVVGVWRRANPAGSCRRKRTVREGEHDSRGRIGLLHHSPLRHSNVVAGGVLH
jgi:hypothetical protein